MRKNQKGIFALNGNIEHICEIIRNHHCIVKFQLKNLIYSLFSLIPNLRSVFQNTLKISSTNYSRKI